MAIVAFCYAYAPSITNLTNRLIRDAITTNSAQDGAKKFLVDYDVIIGTTTTTTTTTTTITFCNYFTDQYS